MPQPSPAVGLMCGEVRGGNEPVWTVVELPALRAHTGAEPMTHDDVSRPSSAAVPAGNPRPGMVAPA